MAVLVAVVDYSLYAYSIIDRGENALHTQPLRYVRATCYEVSDTAGPHGTEFRI